MAVKNLKHAISQIEKIYPQCKNYKGSFNWSALSEPMWSNCVKGDYWINDNTNDIKAMHCYLHYPNDVMYWDGTNITPLRLPKENNTPLKNRYDICIVGGGAGGMGCAYALKDKGYNVILIEKLDTLGGTHINGGIPILISSPITGTWFKTICQDAYNNNPQKLAFVSSVEVGSGTTFEKLWRGGLYTTAENNRGSQINMSYWWTSQRYLSDLSDNIDIRLRTELIESYVNGDIVGGIKVKNLDTGETYNIFAEYFIDCSADGCLCRSGKTIDVDYFIGSDSKTLYNEGAYANGYVGDKYKINTVEGGYRVLIDSYLPGDKMRIEDRTKWKSFTDITTKVNGKSDNPGEYSSVISTSTGNSIDPHIFIDKGNDYAHSVAYPRSKAHLMGCGYSGSKYAEQCKMLGIRESYRIKCDRMLTQIDCETRATSANMVSNHTIALSSWYVDIHNDSALQNAINNSWLNAVPYESLVPSVFKNVLVGSRCFGCSHIAQASYRLTKVMMSIGYACGHAISQCVDDWLDDVRDIDIAQLQTDVGIAALMTEMETYFSV
jgi:hypothetical protein